MLSTPPAANSSTAYALPRARQVLAFCAGIVADACYGLRHGQGAPCCYAAKQQVMTFLSHIIR